MTKNSRTVAVVGAGIAGLAAACDLAQASVSVALIEARERTGGRVYTQHDPLSVVPIELGAEFIHGKPPELLTVVEKEHLLYADATLSHWYFENGKLSKSGDFWYQLNKVMEPMNGSGPDRSFTDFLDSQPNDPETRRAKAIAARYVQGFHAARTERIGIHGLIKANEAEDEIDGEKAFRVLSGYDSVARALLKRAEKNGVGIHLNTVVREINWSPDEVELVSEGDKGACKFQASAAVITLPLGVLQTKPDQLGAVRFQPELPEQKKQAIDGLAVGEVIKLTLRFQNRFWEGIRLPGVTQSLEDLGFIHFPEAAFPTWWTSLPVRAPLLIGWVGGPAAEPMLERGRNFIVKQGLASLSKILHVAEPELEQLLAEAYFHDWATDVFSRGAYSYVPVNGLAAQKTLAEPMDKTLFFAGEALAVGHIGTVHGALMTGQRAAREVLKIL